jgi:hypothetical protein
MKPNIVKRARVWLVPAELNECTWLCGVMGEDWANCGGGMTPADAYLAWRAKRGVAGNV